MKKPFVIILKIASYALFVLLLFSPISAQDSCFLKLERNWLNGLCNNPHFTGFKIELDTIYESIDRTMLLHQLPRVGSIHFKKRVYIPTEFTSIERSGVSQILFRFKNSYYTFDNLTFNEKGIQFNIDLDPEVPFTKDDLETILIAKSLLERESNWHKEDDRICRDDLANQKYSVYCALRIASIEVEERYNHRGAVMQCLRHEIEKLHPNKAWQHRLMDFNNMPETTHDDILNIVSRIEERIRSELGELDKSE